MGYLINKSHFSHGGPHLYITVPTILIGEKNTLLASYQYGAQPSHLLSKINYYKKIKNSEKNKKIKFSKTKWGRPFEKFDLEGGLTQIQKTVLTKSFKKQPSPTLQAKKETEIKTTKQKLNRKIDHAYIGPKHFLIFFLKYRIKRFTYKQTIKVSINNKGTIIEERKKAHKNKISIRKRTF